MKWGDNTFEAKVARCSKCLCPGQVGRRQSWPFSDWKGWESRSTSKRTGVKQSVVLILLFSLTLSIIGDGDRNLLRLLRSHRDPADQSHKDIPRILWTCRSCKSLNYCSVLCHGLTKYFNKFNFINYIKVNMCKKLFKIVFYKRIIFIYLLTVENGQSIIYYGTVFLFPFAKF